MPITQGTGGDAVSPSTGRVLGTPGYVAPSPTPTRYPTPTGGGGGAFSGSSLTPFNPEPVDTETLTDRFPYLRWMLGIPQLKQLLDSAYAEQWGMEEFEANLWMTNWWRTRSSSARAWDEAISRDPAQVNRRREARRTYLTQQAGQLGVLLSREEIDDLTEQSLRWDYTREEMQDALGGMGTITFGDVSASADEIMADSRAFLLDFDRATAEDMARRIASGHLTRDGVTSRLRDMAKANFPQFADAIDDGFTISEATFALRNQVAQTLEMRPDDIDFRDPRFADLLSLTDEAGKPRVPTLGEGTRWARQQDSYYETEQAMQKAEEAVFNIRRRLGT